MLLMWKPVRLQGVGAAVGDHQRQHASRRQAWIRGAGRSTACSAWPCNGMPHRVSGKPFDPTGTATAARDQSAADGSIRMPLEGIVGWDTHAQRQPGGAAAGAHADGRLRRRGHHGARPRACDIPEPDQPTSRRRAEAGFPAGSTLLTNGQLQRCGPPVSAARLQYVPSNFQCNPSRIDGLTHHQQLAGRRRHLRARLDPQPADRQQPHLRTTPARCPAASPSARANSRRVS